MNLVMLEIGLLLICLPLSYLFMRSTVQCWLIHRHLRIGMTAIRRELNDVKHHPARQYDLLSPVYRSVVFQTYPKLKLNRNQLEQLVSEELNRIVKYGALASFAVYGRGVIAAVMIGMSVGGGVVLLQEVKQWNVASLFEPGTGEREETVLGTTFKLSYEVRSPRTLGTAIAFHMSRFDETFTIRYTGDAKNMEQTMEAAWDWIEEHHIYIFRLQRGGESKYTDHGGFVDISIRMDYDMTAEEAMQVKRRVDDIVQVMPDTLDPLEKVKYINDFVVLNTAYNLESVASPYTPYSILMNQEGVCEGYALTTLLLLEAAGVNARYISGEAGEGLHAWNLVQVDGEWYHLDTTWNDPLPDRPGEVRYDYFLVSDTTMRQDHAWEADAYPVTGAEDYKL